MHARFSDFSGIRAAVPLFLTAHLCIIAATAIAENQYTPGSDAWIRKRRFDLRLTKEVEKADKKAEARKAEFLSEERRTRQPNEPKDAAGRRIAKINARLKLRPMIDAGHKDEAEAIALSITAHLGDPDFELVKFWKPVESKKMVHFVVADLKKQIEDESTTHAALASEIAKLTELVDLAKNEKKRGRSGKEAEQRQAKINTLKKQADESFARIQYNEKLVDEFVAAGKIPLFKLCIEYKPAKKNGVEFGSGAPTWTPESCYFVITEFGAILMVKEDEIEAAAGEFSGKK